MAVTIAKTQLKFNEFQLIPAAVSISGGAEIIYDKDDSRCFLMIENTGTSDLALSIEAKKIYCGVIESGKYVNMNGDKKGRLILASSSANLSAACVVLP